MTARALLLAFVLAGCAAPLGPPRIVPVPAPASVPAPEDPAVARFQRAAALLKQERFADAAREFRAVADGFPNHARAPEALYQAALAQTHHRNSAVDLDGAVRDLQRLVRGYPAAVRRDEAQTWIAWLTQYTGLLGERDRLKADLQRLLDLDVESERKRRQAR